MDDTEMLDLIEHCGWSVRPQARGGWVIESDDEQQVELARTCGSLREAIREAQYGLGIEQSYGRALEDDEFDYDDFVRDLPAHARHYLWISKAFNIALCLTSAPMGQTSGIA